MRLSTLCATLLLGCSIDRAGLGTPASDAAIDTTRVVDTFVPLDTTIVDTFLPVDGSAVVDAREVSCDLLPGDPCAEIHPLLLPQTIDGNDTEFCNVPYVDLDVTNADFLASDPPAEWVSSSVRARIAWSSLGLHMHFAVKDALYAPAPVGTDHWKGDVVEVFAAGHAKLTGAFDGKAKDKGAVQIIFTRPQTDGATRAAIWYGTYFGELDGKSYATVERTGGYDVEVFLPWKLLEGTSIAKGSTIAFDFAINDRQSLDSPEDQYIGYHLRKPTPADYCGGFYCDDRVWCRPKLQ